MAVAAVVVVVIIVLAVVRLVPAHGGAPGLPSVLSVIPASSEAALSTGWSLANNTTGGPWTPYMAEGWDNTLGLDQVPSGIQPNASCPLENAAISRYGVLGYNGSYATGYAEGWFWVFTSPNEGATDLFVWVGDGIAYDVGAFVGSVCAPFLPVVEMGMSFTSTGVASAGFTATNYTRFAATFPTANASYWFQWEDLPPSFKAVPFWIITFNACNGTIPEASTNWLYGSNGTVQLSTYGESPGALCGSSDGAIPMPTHGEALSAPVLGARRAGVP
jgi:hypothetical protein